MRPENKDAGSIRMRIDCSVEQYQCKYSCKFQEGKRIATGSRT